MKTSIYSYCWDIIRFGFDYRNALDNWVRHAQEIVIAVNTSTDGTYEAIESYAKERGYPVRLIATYYDPVVDPFYYGKVVDAALQACTGDLLIAQDMDERIRFAPGFPAWALQTMAKRNVKALFIPTIDLYGSTDQYCRVGQKWYAHLPGLHRGAVSFGIKEGDRPDYNRTSTDELIDAPGRGNLVPTIPLWHGDDAVLAEYVSRGLPLVYHLGFLSLKDRAERAVWWKAFWERATAGDPNSHETSVEELMKRETKPHGLPLWEPQPLRGWRTHTLVIDDPLIRPPLVCKPLDTGPLRGQVKYVGVLDEGYFTPKPQP